MAFSFLNLWDCLWRWMEATNLSVKEFMWGQNHHLQSPLIRINGQGFPGGAVVENLPANAGDTGSSPGLGRSHMLRSN